MENNRHLELAEPTALVSGKKNATMKLMAAFCPCIESAFNLACGRAIQCKRSSPFSINVVASHPYSPSEHGSFLLPPTDSTSSLGPEPGWSRFLAFQPLNFLKNNILCLYMTHTHVHVCVCACVLCVFTCMPGHLCGGQRTTCRASSLLQLYESARDPIQVTRPCCFSIPTNMV